MAEGGVGISVPVFTNLRAFWDNFAKNRASKIPISKVHSSSSTQMEDLGKQEEETCGSDETTKGPRFLVARRLRSQFKPIRTADMMAAGKANSSNLANTPRRKKASMFAPIRTPSLMVSSKRGKSPGQLYFRDIVGHTGTPAAKRLSMGPSVRATEKENAPELLNQTAAAQHETSNPFSLSSKQSTKGLSRRRRSSFKPVRPNMPPNADGSVVLAKTGFAKDKVFQPNMDPSSSNLSVFLFGTKDFNRTPKPSALSRKPALNTVDESFMELSGAKTNSNSRKLNFLDVSRPVPVRMQPQPSTSTGVSALQIKAIPHTNQKATGGTKPKMAVSKIPVKPGTKTLPAPSVVQSNQQRMGAYARQLKGAKPILEQAPRPAVVSRSFAAQTSPHLTACPKPLLVEFGTQTTPTLQALRFSDHQDVEKPTSSIGILPTPERCLKQSCELSPPRPCDEIASFPKTPTQDCTDSANEICVVLEKLSCSPKVADMDLTIPTTSTSDAISRYEQVSLTMDEPLHEVTPDFLDSTLTDHSIAPTFEECFSRTQLLVTPSHRMTAIHQRISKAEPDPARAMYLSYRETFAHLRTPQAGRFLAVSAPSGCDLNSKRLQEQISLLFSEDDE